MKFLHFCVLLYIFFWPFQFSQGKHVFRHPIWSTRSFRFCLEKQIDWFHWFIWSLFKFQHLFHETCNEFLIGFLFSVFKDYVFDDRKFGGNAQSITKHRWIHHTSFLWDYEVKNMSYLKLPAKAPEYRLVSLCFFISSLSLSLHWNCSYSLCSLSSFVGLICCI